MVNKSKNNLILLLLLSFVFILSLIIINTKNDKSNNNMLFGNVGWAEFSTQKPNVSFKYPSNWHIRTYPNAITIAKYQHPDGVRPNLENKLSTVFIGTDDTLSESAASDKYKTFEELISDWPNSCPWPSCALNYPEVIKTTTFNNHETVVTEVSNVIVKTPHVRYYIKVEGKDESDPVIYSIDFPIDFFEDEKNQDVVKTYKKIFSTMKFY